MKQVWKVVLSAAIGSFVWAIILCSFCGLPWVAGLTMAAGCTVGCGLGEWTTSKFQKLF